MRVKRSNGIRHAKAHGGRRRAGSGRTGGHIGAPPDAGMARRPVRIRRAAVFRSLRRHMHDGVETCPNGTHRIPPLLIANRAGNDRPIATPDAGPTRDVNFGAISPRPAPSGRAKALDGLGWVYMIASSGASP